MRSGASCPPSESSEAKIHVLLTVTGMIEFFMLHCALPDDMPLQSAHNLVTNAYLYRDPMILIVSGYRY